MGPVNGNNMVVDEGMHVFEYWGGEYRPLAELIAEMDAVKAENRTKEQ